MESGRLSAIVSFLITHIKLLPMSSNKDSYDSGSGPRTGMSGWTSENRDGGDSRFLQGVSIRVSSFLHTIHANVQFLAVLFCF